MFSSKNRVQREGSSAGVNQLSPMMIVRSWQASRGPRAWTTLPGHCPRRSAGPHGCAKGNHRLARPRAFEGKDRAPDGPAVLSSCLGIQRAIPSEAVREGEESWRAEPPGCSPRGLTRAPLPEELSTRAAAVLWFWGLGAARRRGFDTSELAGAGPRVPRHLAGAVPAPRQLAEGSRCPWPSSSPP